MKDHGYVYIQLPTFYADYIRRLYSLIPTDHLAGEQDDDPPHITVCWGILSDDPYPIWQAAVTAMPFYVRFGKTRVFPPSDSSNHAAVVYVEVFSPFLEIIHQNIKHSIPTKPSEHPYVAHSTIAYVKPSESYRYENNPSMDGKEFLVDYINMKEKSGRRRTIWMHPYRVE